MPEYPDQEARTKAYKALTVIFIVAVVVVNLILMIKSLRRGRLLLNQRRFLIVTLSGADMLVAMFPLVVQARLWYDGYSDCEHTIISNIYLQWFLPFLYGFALITLCVELVNRTKINASIIRPPLASLVLAAIPWILALVTILPLTLDGFYSRGRERCDYDDPDFTQNRERACYVIGAIIPSLLAVIATYSTSGLISPSSSTENETTDLVASENDAKKEQQTLVIVALANAALTLPFSFFMVTEAGSLDPVPKAVIYDICLWLLILRSVAIPSIWLNKIFSPTKRLIPSVNVFVKESEDGES